MNFKIRVPVEQEEMLSQFKLSMKPRLRRRFLLNGDIYLSLMASSIIKNVGRGLILTFAK